MLFNFNFNFSSRKIARKLHEDVTFACWLRDLGGGRLLLQALAAAERPLAVDVLVHEELRRHDVHSRQLVRALLSLA